MVRSAGMLKLLCITLLATYLPLVFAENAKILRATVESTLVDASTVASIEKLAGKKVSAPNKNLPLKLLASVETGKNQTFTDVLVDTGSGILWVGGQKRYKPGRFSKRLGDFAISYAVGFASGPAYTDRVKIGDAIVKSQIIGAANHTEGNNIVLSVDGILGLAPSGANSGQIIGHESTPNFVESLVKEGSIDKPTFGIHISPLNPKTGKAISTGEITFGGVDEDRFTGKIVWLPTNTLDSLRWAFNVTSFSFGTLKLMDPAALTARTDCGVSGIGVPFDFLYEILAAVPGSTITGSDDWFGLAFPPNQTASTLPPLRLGLGEKNKIFELPASLYLIPKALYAPLGLTKNLTYSWIGPGGSGSFMLGQQWLQGLYSAYDMERRRIGFALPKN
ncbi:acid protease [Cristinia sonorae]|uniref:Acid protease n=1 Tax=Cristinia sonorae TaxID=1940300 RepID=A0A8K0UV90_9AGAR|nr:acid protease [Cristinia sonorae]